MTGFVLQGHITKQTYFGNIRILNNFKVTLVKTVFIFHLLNLSNVILVSYVNVSRILQTFLYSDDFRTAHIIIKDGYIQKDEILYFEHWSHIHTR